MSCNSITMTLGSCIDLELAYTDSTGAPENITGNTFGIEEASRPALKNAVLTITSAANGKVSFHLPSDQAEKLSLGNINWFRVTRTLSSGCDIVTEKIWVNII